MAKLDSSQIVKITVYGLREKRHAEGPPAALALKVECNLPCILITRGSV